MKFIGNIIILICIKTKYCKFELLAASLYYNSSTSSISQFIPEIEELIIPCIIYPHLYILFPFGRHSKNIRIKKKVYDLSQYPELKNFEQIIQSLRHRSIS